MINCCAADALPLAIAVDLYQAGAFANDQWVQVDGILGSCWPNPQRKRAGSFFSPKPLRPVHLFNFDSEE